MVICLLVYVHNSCNVSPAGRSISLPRSQLGMAFIKSLRTCSSRFSLTASNLSSRWAVSRACRAASRAASAAPASIGLGIAISGVGYAFSAFFCNVTKKFSGVSFFKSNLVCSSFKT